MNIKYALTMPLNLKSIDLGQCDDDKEEEEDENNIFYEEL